MEKSKIPSIIVMAIIILYSGFVFFTKGLPLGLSSWKFYASLIGVILPILFLVFLFRSIKK